MTDEKSQTAPRDGVLFAATGAGYVSLAIRAAEAIRHVSPGLAIDLFTDEDPGSDVFDRVVVIEDVWHRSRIDAMQATRFERTLHLDADIMVLADFRDVFDVLERFDIALAHDQFRNGLEAQVLWCKPLPAAFPQFNGGVIAYRRTDPVMRFLRGWAEVMRREKLRRDQPVLRELLWESDLRIATLPEEYNLMDFEPVARWSTKRAAPRILHHFVLHNHFSGSRRFAIERVDELVGPAAAARLPELLKADQTLPGNTPSGISHTPGVWDRWRIRLRVLAAWARLYAFKAARRLRSRGAAS